MTLNRNDEDREINHHGRPVDVGEAESRPASTAKVFCQCDMLLDNLFLLFFVKYDPWHVRLLTKTLLLWMNKFSWRRWKASTKGEEIVISDFRFAESFDFRADNMRDKRKRSLERCQRYCVCWDWNCCILYICHIDHIFYVQVHIGLQPSSCANLCLRLLDHRPYPCILRLDIEGKKLSKIVKNCQICQKCLAS